MLIVRPAADCFPRSRHAVVGWALGYKVEKVEITSDLSGSADITFPGPIRDVEQVTICKAGWVGAERSGVENLNDDETLKDELDPRRRGFDRLGVAEKGQAFRGDQHLDASRHSGLAAD
ncbi:hypothetical protein AAII07_40875 [Microvirga sp. 0TCS3.31]